MPSSMLRLSPAGLTGRCYRRPQVWNPPRSCFPPRKRAAWLSRCSPNLGLHRLRDQLSPSRVPDLKARLAPAPRDSRTWLDRHRRSFVLDLATRRPCTFVAGTLGSGGSCCQHAPMGSSAPTRYHHSVAASVVHGRLRRPVGEEADVPRDSERLPIRVSRLAPPISAPRLAVSPSCHAVPMDATPQAFSRVY